MTAWTKLGAVAPAAPILVEYRVRPIVDAPAKIVSHPTDGYPSGVDRAVWREKVL